MAVLNRTADTAAEVLGSDNPWTSVADAEGAADSVYASCSIPLLSAAGPLSNPLQLTAYNFPSSLLGVDTRIDGIRVQMTRLASSVGGISDYSIRLMKAGSAVGDDKAAGAAWSDSEEIVTFGSTSDLWGTTWTADDIVNSGFGVQIQCQNPVYDASGETGYVDSITISVSYTAGGGNQRRIIQLMAA